MTKPEDSPVDLDALAQRYIELWQDQVARMSEDASVAALWRPFLENAGKTAGWTPETLAATFSAFQSQTARGAARATSAAAPSDDGGDDLADVLCRLDAIEQRLAALEADQDSN